ncbi:HesA/MoeB/ThiF family protein [Demequina sp. NBRC 110054]|uniref:HesA/MoeB/ThiF family protein n=1 Tax=Demequina sp. NBRC 110054 TaxID=1570343 RepID=UPI001356361D|nr:HesA/MoeB/ThiF family protein [Demequina sp. NBRC 110054]
MSDPFVRQRIVPGFGEEGQERLASARVAIVGVGGLGCPAAQYLAASGVGGLTLIDADSVQTSNLPRQILFGPTDVGSPKVDAAATALAASSPWCRVETRAIRLGPDDAGVLKGHDVVIDATDTWVSRRDVFSVTRSLGVPLVWGAVQGWHGQVTVFGDRVGLDDVFPDRGLDPLDGCEGQGVIGPVCGLVGTAMATQTLLALLGEQTMEGRLSIVDGRAGGWRDVPVRSRAGVRA